MVICNNKTEQKQNTEQVLYGRVYHGPDMVNSI